MNIYDKLTTIMNNTPKVYEAGYKQGKKVAENKPYLDTSVLTHLKGIFSYWNDDYGDYVQRKEFLPFLNNIDTSNCTNFNDAFHCCNDIITIPLLDTSKSTSFRYMFQECGSLTTIPLLDTSNGVIFMGMFYNCPSLETIPQLDTSKGTDFNNMFYLCSSLTTIPQLDTSKGTDFNNMFCDCTALETIPQLDTSKGTDFSNMFYNCTALKTISSLNLSNCSSYGFEYMFYKCTALENITFIGTLNPATNRLDLSNSPNLTVDSMLSLFNALVDITGSTAKTITLGSTNLAKLTDEQKAIATNKNWNLK